MKKKIMILIISFFIFCFIGTQIHYHTSKTQEPEEFRYKVINEVIVTE